MVTNNYYIGIDGGGSNLRVVITDSNMRVLGESGDETANPSIIGRDEARQRIQQAIGAVLQETNISSDAVQAVGIGVAGASADHSSAWLREVLAPILPTSYYALSSDVEIALVGAHGQKYGILLLAGTGSCAYGINEKGESLLIGGWGYLLGDEGGGYWIGKELIQLISTIDDRGETDLMHNAPEMLDLKKKTLQFLGLQKPRDIIAWLYRQETAPVRDVASLAPLVLQEAQTNTQAMTIVRDAYSKLWRMVPMLQIRLKSLLPVAFAGGLLVTDNALTQLLCQHFHLKHLPRHVYSPVVGAALLAKTEAERERIAN
jgi:N-acetylglucosamine kinase-like BadF-type ATPase